MLAVATAGIELRLEAPPAYHVARVKVGRHAQRHPLGQFFA